jgi:hypothetical protein
VEQGNAVRDIKKRGKQVKGAGKKGRSLESLGITNQSYGEEAYNSILKAAGSDGKIQASEWGEVEKAMKGARVHGLDPKEGKEGGSTKVTEEEVANTLKKMSDNNLTTAQILANLASGKPANEGLNNPKQ